MSEPTHAAEAIQTAEATQPQEQTNAAAEAPKSKKAAGVAALREMLAAKRAPAPVAETAAPTAQAENTAEAIEDKGGEVPEQREGETDKQYELRLSKALRDLEGAKSETLSERKARQAAETDLKKLQALMAKAKSPETVLEALEEFGWSFEALTKGILEKKVKPKAQGPALPADVQEKIDRLERAEKEREAERVRAQAEAQRKQDIVTVSKVITDNAEDFPLLAQCDWAAESAVTQAYSAGGRSIGPILQELEASIAKDMVSLLSKEGAVKALLKSNDSLRSILTSALGVESKKTAAPVSNDKRVSTSVQDGPKTLSSRSLSSETPTTEPRKLPPQERKKVALANLQSFMAQKKSR